jgi:hypothetical protein
MKKPVLNWTIALMGLPYSLLWPSGVQAIAIGEPIEFSQDHKIGSRFMGVRLLGALKLNGEKVNGLAAHEISGIAWDEDEELLYAMSDRGYVFHIHTIFTEGQLTGADLAAAYPFQDAAGKTLAENLKDDDTEGLALRNSGNGIDGDSELIVSFERTPRLIAFKPDGAYLRDLALPVPLTSITDTAGDPDDGLEAVAEHPQLGLIVAPARPLESGAPRFFTLYSLDGQRWRYPPLDPEHSALVGLEAAPDGSLILLERKFVNFNIFTNPVIFAARRVRPDNRSDSKAFLPVEEIAHFSTADDWSLDNFESIARHQGNRYFLVSDDNTSIIQKTLLVYLEILE